MKTCDFASRLPCLSCFFWAYTSKKEFVPKFPLCYSVSPLRPQPKGQTIRIRYYSNFPLIPNQNFITISYHCKPTAGSRIESRPSKYSTGASLSISAEVREQALQEGDSLGFAEAQVITLEHPCPLSLSYSVVLSPLCHWYYLY